MHGEPGFGKKNYTNGEILLIMITSILIISALFLFINIYINEVNGTKILVFASNSNDQMQIRSETQGRPDEVKPLIEPSPIPTNEPTGEPSPSDSPRATAQPIPSDEPLQTIKPSTQPTPEPAITPTTKPINEASAPPVVALKEQHSQQQEAASKAGARMNTYLHEPGVCVVEGSFTYVRSHVDFERLFISLCGQRENIGENGMYRISLTNTGSEEMVLGIGYDAILKFPIELRYGWMRKDFRIDRIVPALMQRTYDDRMDDKSLFMPVPEQVFSRGNDALARVAITIDDGFVQDEKLLALFRKYGIRCTVFIIGGRGIGNGHPEWLREMDDMGFEIANHSYNHSPAPLLSDAALEKEIRDTQRVLGKVTKKLFPYFRPPGGNYNKRTLAVAARNGYIMINWSNSTGDSVRGNVTERQVAYVLNHLKNGDIILTHFGGYNTYAVMEQIIPEIINRGFELVTVSEILEGM